MRASVTILAAMLAVCGFWWVAGAADEAGGDGRTISFAVAPDGRAVFPVAEGITEVSAAGVAGLVVSGEERKADGLDDWRGEQWVVEAFTDAMGGGPAWGPAAGVGASLWSMVQDRAGNFYLVVGRGSDADGSQFVDIITPDGIRRHLAGSGALGFRDGPAEEAQFRMGVGAFYDFCNIGCDDRGNVFVPDNGNNRIRRIFKDDAGRWMVQTWAGGGKTALAPGQNCPALEAAISGNLHVAVAPDGTVTVGSKTLVYRITPDGRTITCLGRWPDSVGVYGGKPAPPGGTPTMNLCGGGCDRDGNAYFAARSNDVVCKVDAVGRISHIAGSLVTKSHPDSVRIGDRAPPTLANFDTPSSMFVDFSGRVVYVCGGDEYDIRRVPTDEKTTTATLLQNGRWYVMEVHPNKNRGRPIFDPRKTGPPKTAGGNVTNLMCSPLVGIDRAGNLYGKLNSWTGATTEIAGRGLLGTRVFRIRRVDTEKETQ